VISCFAVGVGTLLNTAGALDPKASLDPAGQPQPAQKGDPFSLSYSLNYSPGLTASADAQCGSGYPGVMLKGRFNERGDPTRNPIPWIAHLDLPGHIDWAVRLADNTGVFHADVACAQNLIYAAFGTGTNRGSIGKFAAGSLTPLKAVQEALRVEPADGTTVTRPDSFVLLNLALKLDGNIEPAKSTGPASRIGQEPEPAQQSSYSREPKTNSRALGDPQPIAYRATGELSKQTDGAVGEREKPNPDITADPRYGLADARLNKVYSSLRSILSPAKKEDLKRELVIGGSGTTRAVIEADLEHDPGRNSIRVLWSPESDKVLVMSDGDEGTNDMRVGWLRGSAWQSDSCPQGSDVPPRYLGKHFTFLGWLSDDTFKVSNAIILNSREPLPAERYKVRITAKGPEIVD